MIGLTKRYLQDSSQASICDFGPGEALRHQHIAALYVEMDDHLRRGLVQMV